MRQPLLLQKTQNHCKLQRFVLCFTVCLTVRFTARRTFHSVSLFFARAPFGPGGLVAECIEPYLYSAVDSRPGPGGSRATASCQPEARRPRTIPLRYSVGYVSQCFAVRFTGRVLCHCSRKCAMGNSQSATQIF